jgi:hypothetical protein
MRNDGQELVGALRSLVIRDTYGSIRLKVLKDEIRKPYFISLKEFLWKEGVHGPDDSAEDLKVYPARKIYIRPARAIPGLTPHGYGHSTEYLLMVKLYPTWQS